MRIFTFIGFICFCSLSALAQIPVDTMPHNKNVLIEEYTGVRCNSCPQGHIEISNLLAAYPNRVFAAGMHSASVGHSTPYGTDEDLRRPFPDVLRTKIVDLNGIPGGIISRRASSTGKECYTFWPFNGFHQPIDSACNVVMNEASPFNIGIVATYDTVNKILNVTSQVYTTATTNKNYKINVYFTQSNIIADQLNGNTVITGYNHKHVFREILTPTWGGAMYPSGTTKGDIFNHTITFTNNNPKYKMQDVEVLVFITDHTVTTNDKGHVVTVLGAHPTLTGSTTGINELVKSVPMSVYPNPSANEFYIHLSNPTDNNELYVYDVSGKLVMKQLLETKNNSYISHQLSPGVYFVTTKNNPDNVSKLIVQ